MAGDAANPISNLYGLAFDISFDKTLIKNAFIKYTSSFLNASATNVEFRKSDLNIGVAHAASVRTTGSNVNGFGKIGELYFELFNFGNQSQPTNFDVVNPVMIGSSGVTSTLSGSSNTVMTTGFVVNINEANPANLVGIYPNPSNGTFFLQGNGGLSIRFHVQDLAGRILATGEFTGTGNLNLQHLSPGTYLIRLEYEGKSGYKKLVIE
jgi:hypothetical protein